jgi:hypothetical protein
MNQQVDALEMIIMTDLEKGKEKFIERIQNNVILISSETFGLIEGRKNNL